MFILERVFFLFSFGLKNIIIDDDYLDFLMFKVFNKELYIFFFGSLIVLFIYINNGRI